MTGRGWLGVFFAGVALAGGAFAWLRFEGDAPQIAGPEALLLGKAGAPLVLRVSDAGSGVRSVRVELRVESLEPVDDIVVAEHDFPGTWLVGAADPSGVQEIELLIEPGALDLRRGSARIVATVRDWSLRGAFLGNAAELEIPLEVDLEKPRIQVASGLTYIGRGGASAVAYTISEEAVRDGVAVGDAFFPGYPAPGEPAGAKIGRRVALFAIPTDAPRDPKIEVVAEDAAGNVGRGTWAVVVKERVLPEANVTLPKSFLDVKVRDLAELHDIVYDDPKRTFDEINTKMRAANEARIQSVVAKSAEQPLWQGRFSQMTNSKVTSRFAEQRSYFSDGERVSQATHFGYDLASISGAPIEASNAGVVVYADDLGIYGNCVIIDHGYGLFTLYAHLTNISVSVGDTVDKNERIGTSGATGLAGGDHLHFGVIVGGYYVDPIEWWDGGWVQTHIEERLDRPTSG